ncbi:RHS repeat domain-containing protein [Mucilaginibacter gilvus]|uniref:YD repeat-containing protein n=1 Tax=Mucilaginibacter gilvus TaxID=2305909 RepID=A0A444MJV4_9SPHI|nr:RHS repeat domain-containing protein [Mucilaginibacter gilvus]RWY49139.1 hypothetical protein EPL05_17105 [Mucilaginibacter gilvus]
MIKSIKYLLIFAVLALMLQSCAKVAGVINEDDKNLVLDEAAAVELPEVSIPLVKTITTKQAEIVNGQEFYSLLVERFKYDSKNRVTSYDYNNGNWVYEYTYDVANRVTGVAEDAGNYLVTYKYIYYKDRIVATSNRDGYSIFFDEKRRLGKIMPYGSPSSTQYLYDGRGNMTGKAYVLSSETPPYGTHTFDDKKNPFSRVAGYNLHFNYLATVNLKHEVLGNINNPLFADNSTGVSIGTRTYTYNAGGYPLTSKTIYNDGKHVDYETYEYTQ